MAGLGIAVGGAGLGVGTALLGGAALATPVGWVVGGVVAAVGLIAGAISSFSKEKVSYSSAFIGNGICKVIKTKQSSSWWGLKKSSSSSEMPLESMVGEYMGKGYELFDERVKPLIIMGKD
jgi:hypothetical protein